MRFYPSRPHIIKPSALRGLPVLLPLLALALPAPAVEVPTSGSPHPSQPGYRLVWQDEFSGSTLDRKKWRAVDDPTLGKLSLIHI